jgi:hypothetical protein
MIFQEVVANVGGIDDPLAAKTDLVRCIDNEPVGAKEGCLESVSGWQLSTTALNVKSRGRGFRRTDRVCDVRLDR